MKMLIKPRKKINDNEFNQIKSAYFKEFNEGWPTSKKDIINHTFFLLVEKKKILAIGSFVHVEPIRLKKETFSIVGIGGIVSNQKRKGFGKKIMMAIKKHLLLKDKTGVGFCEFRNIGFYEKCGFKLDKDSIKQFVYYKGDQKILNTTDDYITYLEGSDNFMKKVLSSRKESILLPRPPDW